MFNKKRVVTVITFILLLDLILLIPPVEALNWSADTLTVGNPSWFDTAPSIKQISNGSMWLVWHADKDIAQLDLFYNISNNNGATWFGGKLTSDPNNDMSPDIIQTNDNTIWVVWVSNRLGTNVNWRIFRKKLPNNQPPWSSETNITSAPLFDEVPYYIQDTNPSIMQAADGKMWLTWERQRVVYDRWLGLNNYTDIFYEISADGNTWTPYRLTGTEATPGPGNNTNPTIMQTKNGVIWIAYESDRNGNVDLYYKVSTNNGATWSNDIQLTSHTLDDIGPEMIETGNGQVWVFWSRGGGPTSTQYNIWYKTSLDYGQTWSAETELVTNSNSDLAAAATQAFDGKIWLVWHRILSEDIDIYRKVSDAIPVQDVAITGITLTETQVYLGWTTTIYVDAQNQGTSTETFNVTAYADSLLIGKQQVTLAPMASTRLTYSWNTINAQVKTYTISANATIMPQEALINRNDNQLTDGTINVKLNGDVNGDKIVDLLDLILVARAYGSHPGDPLYSSAVDLNRDLEINIVDLVIISLNYGQQA